MAIAVTPGKPDAPTERIEVQLTGGDCVVTVERSPATAAAASADRTRTDLQPDDPGPCEALFEQAEAMDLLHFEAEEVNDDEHDATTFDVRIDQGTGSHTVHWTGSVKHQDDIDELLRRAGALAIDDEGRSLVAYFP